MTTPSTPNGPILRLFQVQAKPGCVDTLMDKFATTSAEVVRGEPGNEGYFFGRGIANDQGMVVFASVWANMDAIKARFGDDWQESFLPEGYADLIETCSVHHIDMTTGWHVQKGG